MNVTSKVKRFRNPLPTSWDLHTDLVGPHFRVYTPSVSDDAVGAITSCIMDTFEEA